MLSTTTTTSPAAARELDHPELAEQLLSDLGLKPAWYGAQVWRLRTRCALRARRGRAGRHCGGCSGRASR